jgi:hypothetical protein
MRGLKAFCAKTGWLTLGDEAAPALHTHVLTGRTQVLQEAQENETISIN